MMMIMMIMNQIFFLSAMKKKCLYTQENPYEFFILINSSLEHWLTNYGRY